MFFKSYLFISVKMGYLKENKNCGKFCQLVTVWNIILRLL